MKTVAIHTFNRMDKDDRSVLLGNCAVEAYGHGASRALHESKVDDVKPVRCLHRLGKSPSTRPDRTLLPT
jgi:hypothetical protein